MQKLWGDNTVSARSSSANMLLEIFPVHPSFHPVALKKMHLKKEREKERRGEKRRGGERKRGRQEREGTAIEKKFHHDHLSILSTEKTLKSTGRRDYQSIKRYLRRQKKMKEVHYKHTRNTKPTYFSSRKIWEGSRKGKCKKRL
jgi:hypothetical protein